MGLFDLFKKKGRPEPIDGIPPSTWLPTPPPVYDYDRSTQTKTNAPNSTKPIQKAKPKTEVKDEDFNPFDMNSIISWYKRQNPNATEKDILNFVTKLAEPAKDQDHLTPEGDLPWGWHTVHKNDITPIESEYKKNWQTWFDSRLKSPNEQLLTLQLFVECMIKIKKLCEEKNECFVYWRDALFTDDFLQRMSNELIELRTNIDELQVAFETKQKFEAYEMHELENNLLQIISSSPGILQKDVYKMFDPIAKNYIQEKLYYAEKTNKIIREKSGNTYKLFLK